MAVERSEEAQMNLGRLGGERREERGEEEREEREERLVNLDIFRVKIQSRYLIIHSPIWTIKMDNISILIFVTKHVATVL